jgi:hypothetical protein
MPIVGPGGNLIFLISDLVNEVLIRTENRTSDTTRAAVWVRDSLIEISQNPDYRDDFQGLESYGQQINLTSNQQEYEESDFLTPGLECNAILDVLIWVDYPTNSNRRKLDVAHYQKTDKFQPVYSLPTEWYTYSSLIGFNPIPDQPYQVQVRFAKNHPISDDLVTTPILLPREWNEILIWAAVKRGFMELMEYEKATSVNMLLYGDPKNVGQPGLIFHVKRKRRKEQWRQEQRLTYTRRPSMWGYGS